jgi:hypothetical protein
LAPASKVHGPFNHKRRAAATYAGRKIGPRVLGVLVIPPMVAHVLRAQGASDIRCLGLGAEPDNENAAAMGAAYGAVTHV